MTNSGVTVANVSQTLSGIGQRLRRIRLEHGISLRELARRLDLSPSAVSKIETGKMRPSLRTLHALVAEFELSVDEVFGEHGRPSPRERPVVAAAGPIAIERGNDRPSISLNSGVVLARLMSWADDLELVEATYAPGGSSRPPSSLVPHPEQEFGYVLSGTLRVIVGSEGLVLSAGDSISFPSRTPHRLVNDGPEHARAIWVVRGRHGSNVGLEAHGHAAS